VGQVHASLAPSMDIQVASNFERFIYYSLGRDGARVREAMDGIKARGQWSLPGFERGAFSSSRCTDSEITGIIRDVHAEHGYIVDPHTACGFKGLDPAKPSVVLATASPAKFPEAIRAAIGLEPTEPSLEALKSLPLVRHKIVADAAAIRAFIDSRAV
jgi:threonine synthase